jgi:Phage integrase, N-terminal SAM-like domain
VQRGTITQQNGKWCLRYYESVLKDGKLVRKKSFKVLAAKGRDYPTERSVRKLADEIVAPLNRQTVAPESSMLFADFFDNHYLPWAKKNLRPSTVNNYEFNFNKHCRERLDGLRLRDFRTVTGRRIVSQVPVGHKTGQRIKSLLSGTLTFALREGVLERLKPDAPSESSGPSQEI